MAKLRKSLGRIALGSLVVLVVSCLPVIPVLTAPVVPDRIYRPTVVSLLQLLGGWFLAGISIQGNWLTLPALVGLIAAAVIAVRYVDRRVFRPRGHS